MVPHAGMNGELTSPGAAYASLHNMSPQMSAAAAAAAVVAYGRSPMVGDLGSMVGPGGSSHQAEQRPSVLAVPAFALFAFIHMPPHLVTARRLLLSLLFLWMKKAVCRSSFSGSGDIWFSPT